MSVPMKRAVPPAAESSLAGSIIARSVRRVVDQRFEARHSGLVDDAVLGARGREQLVRVVNISREGAMVTPALALRIGEPVSLRLQGDVRADGAIRWIRDGRMGVNFTVPLVFEEE